MPLGKEVKVMQCKLHRELFGDICFSWIFTVLVDLSSSLPASVSENLHRGTDCIAAAMLLFIEG